jgi:hypothetical protein
MDTAEFLRHEREPIVDAAVAAIRLSQLDHYEASGPHEVRRRIDRLFDRLEDSIARRDLTPMVSYTSVLADERFGAGFQLSELQTAINALEEATWRRMVTLMASEDLGVALGLVSSALGAGKDALARAYVSLATRRHAPSLDVSALFSGQAAG